MINRQETGSSGQAEPAKSSRSQPSTGAVWLAVLGAAAVLATAAALAVGCTQSRVSTAPSEREIAKTTPPPERRKPSPSPALVIPPAHASPASVAASFFTAWASVDSVRDGPDTALMRCASLITPALARQLRTDEIAPFEWQVMRDHRLVSTIHVQTVTHPVGAPAPTRNRVYLSIYAERVTTTVSGRTVSSAGTSVELTRVGKRWLVAQLLFY
jgi:hypothetical protein